MSNAENQKGFLGSTTGLPNTNGHAGHGDVSIPGAGANTVSLGSAGTGASDTLLQANNLTREYRMGRETVTALGDVDLTVRRGEFVAIMGPSGCGKSTLLNLLGGLDKPTKGSVFLGGQDLSSLNDEAAAALRRKGIGFIFQSHDLLSVLTAQENVEFPMILDGVPPAERHDRAEQLLDLVDLADKARSLPDELSGGQQQRVGIARALANNPPLLLADEPTGNLDSATAAEVLDALTTLVREWGLTLIMVTHDPDDAARADRIVRLKDGRVQTEVAITEPDYGVKL
jgi:putative ABC transport system ATP-binding protein